MILKLNAETFEVVTDKTGAVKPSSDAEFLSALPISEARFAVYDHEASRSTTRGGTTFAPSARLLMRCRSPREVG